MAGKRALMTDASQGYDVGRLTELLPVLQAAELTWLEEPFAVDDTAAYHAWRDCSGRPPLAMGENSIGLSGFRTLMAEISPEVVQPDITKTGGISGGRTICAEVAGPGRMVCLHMYGGPVGLYASAHLAAAIGTVAWVEMDSKRNPLFEQLLPSPPQVVEGRLHLGEAAGLGFDVPERVLLESDVTEA
ncbi:enolase C-terminal domain-like protein [Geminicoccus roseus]|uniref:enolase C-terminal domain-like protein n=1 Tax=Geminicoccus roseus TaxID=404900 RepID=UPI0023E3A137|nr:enolase C-terminal domain-like protein [Geminicoccus roseus]